MTRRRAFTLVELIAVMAIIGAVMGVVGPLIVAAGDAYARSAARREAADRAAYALDRICRLIRASVDSPSGAGAASITTASATVIEFADTQRVELIGSTVWFRSKGNPLVPLCQDVDAFSLTYLADDGATDTSATPALTQRVVVALRTGGIELQSTAFIRTTRYSP